MDHPHNPLDKILADAGIYSPNSNELIQQEKSLVRYLEKEYKTYLSNPITVESTGVSTAQGPVSVQTDDLMETHYDENIELFTGFLDSKYCAYTMAYYGETGDDQITLEQAQYNKFELICKRAKITGNEKIFNIGCGFGPLETYLLEKYPNIEITSITPSKVQIQYIREKMQTPSHPLSNGIELIEGVFDESIVDTLGESRFDLVISIGFFEHALNMEMAFDLIAQLLKPNGRTFHHFITSQVVTRQVQLQQKTVIGKYFPGGRVWPHDELCRHTKRFNLENSWFVNGRNYWRTLTDWHARYWDSIPQLHANNFGIDAIKHWNDYFLLCKTMFAPLDGHFYGNSHYLFTVKL